MEFHGQIDATYEGGVFRPSQRPDLPEGSRVKVLQDQQPTAESRRRGWELIDRIRREKLVQLRGSRLTREDLYDRR
jgi:predicted DNA-binding antitoxin AbrB/MazE fold protein